MAKEGETSDNYDFQVMATESTKEQQSCFSFFPLYFFPEDTLALGVKAGCRSSRTSLEILSVRIRSLQ